MRIVSLIASSTEIACALGLERDLVGRSHECDYPESIRSLPSVSEPKFFPDGKSYEIDQKVRAIVQEGLSVYRVDAERLRALAPDLILTQIQCEVCAVSPRDLEEALREWMGPRPKIVSLNPNTLEDIWEDIRRVAKAAEVVDRGERLVAELRERLESLTRLAQKGTARPRVACIEWIEPLMTAGNWMPELIERAGGIDLFGKPGVHKSEFIQFADLVQADPEIIVVSPCGFDIERTRQEMPALERHPEWQNLRAVRNRQVYLADGNQYFNRPGPRVVEALEIFAEIFGSVSERQLQLKQKRYLKLYQ